MRENTARPSQRAGYVVERLSAVVSGPTEEDWGQIQTELASAYSEIDQALPGKRRATVLRRGNAAVLAYAVVVVLQWQLDWLWRGQGFSPRTFYLPAVMFVLAGLLFIVAAGLLFAIIEEPWAWMWTPLFVTCVVVGLTVAIRAVFGDYTWVQAAIIATFESVLCVVLILVVARTRESDHSAVDPRDRLIADLAAFLAVSALPLRQPDPDADHRPDHRHTSEHRNRVYSYILGYPAVRWSTIAYSTARARDAIRGTSAPSATDSVTGITKDVFANLPELDDEDMFAYRSIDDAALALEAGTDPLPHALRIWNDVWAWRQDRALRRVFGEGIELAADRIERGIPTTAARKGTMVRSSIQDTFARVAATLRSYAADVILGGAERDAAVPSKMCAALVSAAWGRWEDLATEEPTPRVERFFVRFGPRIGVAAILAAVAILVPMWFHQWIGEGTAQFRVVLFTAAALSLTEAPRVAVERLADYAQSVGPGSG